MTLKPKATNQAGCFLFVPKHPELGRCSTHVLLSLVSTGGTNLHLLDKKISLRRF